MMNQMQLFNPAETMKQDVLVAVKQLTNAWRARRYPQNPHGNGQNRAHFAVRWETDDPEGPATLIFWSPAHHGRAAGFEFVNRYATAKALLADVESRTAGICSLWLA